MDILTRAQVFETTRRLAENVKHLSRFTQNPFDMEFFTDDHIEEMCSTAGREFKTRMKELRDLEVQTISLLEAERLRRRTSQAS